MSTNSSIEWTDATWNPLVGCSRRVSAGCEHCYAERFMHRGLHHKGLTRSTSRGPVWTGEVRLVQKALDLPLRWRKPRRVFVNSLSDLFHESVPDEWIDLVFAVMALASRHTFQVLTKRADRMREYLTGERRLSIAAALRRSPAFQAPNRPAMAVLLETGLQLSDDEDTKPRWPLPNVWLGVSAENQEAADERVPLLLQTPAAVRFCSAEPLLSAIDFGSAGGLEIETGRADEWRPRTKFGCASGLDWIIVGGESGPNARPCDVAWIRSIVEQCRAAAVPCFVKQMGRRVLLGDSPYGPPASAHGFRPLGFGCDRSGWWWQSATNRKGGDPSEWPEDLRVQEMPR